MFGLSKYAAGVAIAAAVALSGALVWQTVRVSGLKAETSALRAENALLSANVQAMEMERDLAREAEAVAEARTKAIEAKAQEYDEIREGILKHGEDAVLPDWMLDALVGLLGPGDGGETDQPADPG